METCKINRIKIERYEKSPEIELLPRLTWLDVTIVLYDRTLNMFERDEVFSNKCRNRLTRSVNHISVFPWT